VAAQLTLPPPKLSESQRRHLAAFFRFCPKAQQLRRFSLRFRAMLRWRSAKKLKNWIDSTTTFGFPFVAQFASTLHRDLEVIELSITTPWSNGPIEGHINRLKAIKRQMYGRAGFELLKARVLPWDISKAG
jgi:transposase